MQHMSWARRLELVGDDERCVAVAGLLPVRLLAERSGLTERLSAAMRAYLRRFEPLCSRC